jgi:hypothetical protein
MSSTISASDIEKLCRLLQGSREKAAQSGDYEAALGEHDQVIRQCTRYQQQSSGDANLARKFEILKEKCRFEMKLFQDILMQLSELKKPVNLGGIRTGPDPDYVDPDVWAPPTPLQGANRRTPDDNLPSWAKLAAPQNARGGGGGGADGNRRQSNEGESNSRMRRKDPVPENRRR